jgi:hypothetical protein
MSIVANLLVTIKPVTMMAERTSTMTRNLTVLLVSVTTFVRNPHMPILCPEADSAAPAAGAVGRALSTAG